MTVELRGGLDGQGLRIGIVVARFNEFVTYRLLRGARAALTGHGVLDRDVTVAWVPGSFEIPLVARKLADSGSYDAVVCLGAVIKGETDHYRHVAGEVARGVANAALDARVPVIFGVLTTETVEQALDRAGGGDGSYVEEPRLESKVDPRSDSPGEVHGNTGYNAGTAAIEMVNLVRAMDDL